jgi:hypothetical protein
MLTELQARQQEFSMTTSNSTPEPPPWPEDMEEALTAQEEKLQKMAADGKRRRPGIAIRMRIIRWAVRVTIIAITFWLLCETVIS